ncbi:transposase [Dubosiella newyorkensis]|uniref:transposase n=1 Tax=Dubosiella newyorkensis TaxID=1862672 RepID=UPI003F666476
MAKQYDKEFKEQVIQYVLDHPDLAYTQIAQQFGVHDTTIGGWVKSYKEHDDQVVVRGSGNYASDEAKEIAHLKKQLRDTQDALNVLKKAQYTRQVTARLLYRSVQEYKEKHPKASIAGILALYWRRALPATTSFKIKNTMTKSPTGKTKKNRQDLQRFAPAVWLAQIAEILHKKGIQGCQKYVYSIMKEAIIKPKYLKHKIKNDHI